MIPCIYAGDLPYEVEEEMMAWNDELCYHGDGGCVFHVKAEDIAKLPLFKEWMIEQGWWTAEEANLVSYEEYCRVNSLSYPAPANHFKEYYAWLQAQSRNESLKVAMTGT